MSERTQYRCITPTFNPSIRHNKKLMDGEVVDLNSAAFDPASLSKKH
jgi:hypothetical protein